MSDTTWQKVEERRKMKEKVNNAKTRAQKNDAYTKHQNLDKEKKPCKAKPVKDKDGKVLTKLNEQMEKWNKHFISVLNRPEPDHLVTLPPGEDLNIKVDNIKKHEIKKALKSLKNGKAAGIDGIHVPP